MIDEDIFGNDIIAPAFENYIPKNKNDKLPYVDKYRPKKLDDIVQQTEVIKVLKESLRTGNFPHMLFYGAPGCGKTSTVLAFAMQLFGPNIFNKRVIELNASDERGINVVRNKIITFAKSAVGNPDHNYPSPPYKLIILDEADEMTFEAQSALRTVMENLSSVTRFCFICNYINQIIEPISSRCMKFGFKPINPETMEYKLREIAENENFVISNEVLDKIIDLANGDVRSGINTLQFMKYVYEEKGEITVEDIYETTNYLPVSVIDDVWKKCIENNKATFKEIKQEALFLKQRGYSVNSILNRLSKRVIESNNFSDSQKALISINISNIEKRLIDGSNEYIQLLNILAYIQGIFRKKIKFSIY